MGYELLTRDDERFDSPVPSRPGPSRPVPSRPLPSPPPPRPPPPRPPRPVPSRPVPSRPVPSRPAVTRGLVLSQTRCIMVGNRKAPSGLRFGYRPGRAGIKLTDRPR